MPALAEIDLAALTPEQAAVGGALHAEIEVLEDRNAAQAERIRRLEHIIGELNRVTYGKRSEKLTPDQRQLAFEDLVAAAAEIEAAIGPAAPAPALLPKRPAAARNIGHLPEHLPRIERVIEPESRDCPCGDCPCGCGELAPLRLGHNLRVRGRSGAAGPGGLVATLLDPQGRNGNLIQCHRVSLCGHRFSPPPPYRNSKGCWCLSDVGRERGAVLVGPISGERTFAGEEPENVRFADSVAADVPADMVAEVMQHSGAADESRAVGLSPGDVGVGGIPESHARPSRSMSATSRRVPSCTLAYTEVAATVRWPR